MSTRITVGIVGLGYVGLPLAMEVLKNGMKVVGIDIDTQHLSKLREFESRVEGVKSTELKKHIEAKNFVVSSDFSLIAECSVVIITVPTPLNESHEPDLSALISASTSVAKNIKPGTLLINESTSYPGTLRELIFPIFQKVSINAIESIDFACSPERVDPGNRDFGFANTPRNVSGLSDRAKRRVFDFYHSFVSSVNIVDSPEVAELAKLIENSYRLLNIAFVNELKAYCNAKSISLIESINAAGTKPYGFSAFMPSAGVGGHCIPVDPIYLLESAKISGSSIQTLEAASKANMQMPEIVGKKVIEILGDLKDKKILIEGISYKPNIADIRESAALRIFEQINNLGAKISWHDPLIETWKFPKSKKPIEYFDLIIVCVIHDKTNLNSILEQGVRILDLTGRVPNSPKVISF